MGDPRKIRKKFQTPGHPWQRARIEEEKTLVKEYGFKNKREIWKMGSFLRYAKAQSKKLVTRTDVQGERERKLLLTRLQRLGLLKEDASLDAILSISLRDVLERRLQTQVFKRAMASSVDQARQMITHQHITVAGKTITSPSYLVPLSEEALIAYHQSSAFVSGEHPERVAMLTAKETRAKQETKEGSEERFDKRDKRRPNQRQRSFDAKGPQKSFKKHS
jgi:small subunit ribosomal protein S4